MKDIESLELFTPKHKWKSKRKAWNRRQRLEREKQRCKWMLTPSSELRFFSARPCVRPCVGVLQCVSYILKFFDAFDVGDSSQVI